jgi:hypothetical protein
MPFQVAQIPMPAITIPIQHVLIILFATSVVWGAQILLHQILMLNPQQTMEHAAIQNG